MSEPPACISVLDSADGALELVGAHSAAAGGAVAAAVQTSGFPAQPYASNAEATFVVTGPAVARFEVRTSGGRGAGRGGGGAGGAKAPIEGR